MNFLAFLVPLIMNPFSVFLMMASLTAHVQGDSDNVMTIVGVVGIFLYVLSLILFGLSAKSFF